MVRDLLEKIVRHINKFKELEDIAVQYDTAHAALPWVIARFFLQAAVSEVETFGTMAEGVEITSRVIVQYAEVEKIYPHDGSKLKTELDNAHVRLYAATLTYLCRASNYFGKSTWRRMFKSAFQPSALAVTSSLDRVKRSEEDVGKLVLLIQAEDSLVIHNKLPVH